MGRFGKNKDGSAASKGDASSAPDFAVPDVDTSSQRMAVPAAASTKIPSCGKRFCAEINPCQSWFHVTDPVNGRVLDIPESFAPASCYVFFWKLLYCTACIGSMVWAMIDSSPYFYFAYLTNWGVLWCCLYSIFSVLNTVMASRTGQPAPDKAVGTRIRMTWIFFTLAVHFSAVATLLFWPLIYDPGTTDLQYTTVAPHGVLLALTIMDGFYFNRIPLRWMHYIGVVLPVDILYLIWSVIHSALDIGNPDNNDTDPTTNDDAIYVGVLEWNDDWQTALIWSVIAMFVVGPLIFLVLWIISTGCCCRKDIRKYVDTVDPEDDRPTVYDVEEGSVFAKWR